jgi:1-acyl-sn-glycerol-3-phosphate acyltransferase
MSGSRMSKPSGHRSRNNLSYRIARVVLRNLFSAYFQGRILHPERVPLEGPVLLASNHVSFADPPLIGCCLPRSISYLARDTLFSPPWFGAVLRHFNGIPIDRDGGGPSGLKVVLGRLAQGDAVLLFPEGTRSVDGRLQEARGGIGLLVTKAAVPVIPVRVFGLDRAWGRGNRFPRPHPAAIKFGPPIDLQGLREEAVVADKMRQRFLYDEIGRRIMSGIAALEPCTDRATFAD